MRKTMQIASLLVGAALLGGVAMPSWAVDGVVLIDQNKALAGNVTPGDTPGFPVTISLSGSYRLASNLTVPDANTNAIVIAADHVTIDLNGFAILGPTDCSGGFPCANRGTGIGISTLNANTISGGPPKANITIRNGTIQGMGDAGIALVGDLHLVEFMHVRSNGSIGIQVLESGDQAGSIVQYNTVQRNARAGIGVGRGLVSHNVADVNGDGIAVNVGNASYNVITRNADIGLVLGFGASYIGNVLNGNRVTLGPIGVNLGQNLCDNLVCPGAQF